jgi:hypothetical protein
MKDSETKSQKSVGEKLEAPIKLTPDELEKVAGGRASQVDSKIKTVLTGENPKPPIGIGKL